MLRELHPYWRSQESENSAQPLVCCQTPSCSNTYGQSATIRCSHGLLAAWNKESTGGGCVLTQCMCVRIGVMCLGSIRQDESRLKLVGRRTITIQLVHELLFTLSIPLELTIWWSLMAARLQVVMRKMKGTYYETCERNTEWIGCWSFLSNGRGRLIFATLIISKQDTRLSDNQEASQSQLKNYKGFV